ncbi:aminotransferase-like domain-containing protein [Geosporobacter ferrireducens]|uniref:GntR family transcriptional regulator n=1 Tax=Geosporobacter ferrireducens TaxID=1424294 RepID=A0A1D8GLQ7_9FIRM|nr:PLP-dependent aminotransferase family protein [Geosporobacter ferrireducens]AOT71844.1 GntR family transcriptional regulator [Geosporobacter ferrireducens]
MLNIDWKPDRNSPTQLYLQIAGYIKNKIACGEWLVGTKLPSQRTLSEVFGVNRSTIVAAMEELAAEGVIEGNSGGGTVIINNTWTLCPMERTYNWNNYISSGVHQTNQTIVQQINQAEFDPGIIRLGSCEPSDALVPCGMIQKILKKMTLSGKSLGYEEPRGTLHLRKELCKYLSTLGIAAEPSSVLITSGALQALQLISLGLLHSNSVVYLEKPSYLYSLRTFQSFGMQLSGIPLDEEGINIQELFARHRRKRGAMLFSIPTFHNPTGNVMSPERRKILIDKCGLERLPVIEDDVYREIWFDEQPPMPLKAFDKNGLVLYIGGMSKNMSPGLRIGWIVGSEQVIARLADIKMQTDYGSSSLSQYVAAEMLASGLYTEHNKMMRKNVRKRRDAALAALNRYFKGIASWNTPAGGYFIWLRLNNAISMHQLFIKALKNKILIHPGDLYEYHSNQNIRISYSNASLDEIDFGIKVLSKLVIEQLK